MSSGTNFSGAKLKHNADLTFAPATPPDLTAVKIDVNRVAILGQNYLSAQFDHGDPEFLFSNGERLCEYLSLGFLSEFSKQNPQHAAKLQAPISYLQQEEERLYRLAQPAVPAAP